jgi:16S rRNA (guanine1207-N2)-methyltransferase
MPSHHELELLPELQLERIVPPVLIILGSAGQAAQLVRHLPGQEVTCFHFDLYQAERLKEELGRRSSSAEVRTAADLWDLTGRFQTAIFPAGEGMERQLKLDMVEQAFHVLAERGTLMALSPYREDDLFPRALKKVFGAFHGREVTNGFHFWGRRQGERRRRRHEISFHVRRPNGQSFRFLSRPGVFSYGRLDAGARALMKTCAVAPGDRVLDLGCGCGSNGVWAAKLSGPSGEVVFLDSNLRAVELSRLNAEANDVLCFRTIASASAENLDSDSFDIVLANPPYYAQGRIAEHFVQTGKRLLRPGGRLYLVTKQAETVEMAAQVFPDVEVITVGGYNVLAGLK